MLKNAQECAFFLSFSAKFEKFNSQFDVGHFCFVVKLHIVIFVILNDTVELAIFYE